MLALALALAPLVRLPSPGPLLVPPLLPLLAPLWLTPPGLAPAAALLLLLSRMMLLCLSGAWVQRT